MMSGQGVVEKSDVTGIGSPNSPSPGSSRDFRVSGTKTATMPVASTPTPARDQNRPR